MIEALWDFFGLYKAGSDYLPGFWLTMLLLYLNAGLYLADLYHLVKRKSKAETVSLMAIPGMGFRSPSRPYEHFFLYK